MVNLERMFAGGVAGMAGAAGEVYSDKIKATEYDRKQQVMEKRDKTLASFRHGLNLERDKSQAGIAAGVRAETREYKEGERAKDFGEKKELLGMQLEGQKEISKLTDARWAARYGEKADKPKTPAEQKMLKTQAINDIRAGADSLGGMYISDANVIEVPVTPENKQKIEGLKSLVERKGFNPTFSEAGGFLTISLGGFDYKKAGQPLAKPIEGPKNTFDELQAALQRQTGRSKMNGERKPFQMANAPLEEAITKPQNNSGLAAPNNNSETSDYDMEGYIKKYGQPDQSKGQHLTDEFKLPNHITFSTDSKYSTPEKPGGVWKKVKGGKWSYTPSAFVLQTHSKEELQDYFKRNEPDAVLIFP